MNVDQLKYFLAVAEREHITRAASALHVTQPALSRAIARLEAELGAQLLERRVRAVRLTSQGRVFAEHARRAVEAVDRGKRALLEASDPALGEIRLAFLHTLGSWLVPALLGVYRGRHPAVTFRLVQDHPAAMERLLLAGDVDVALTSMHPASSELTWRPIVKEPLLLFVPARHRLAGRRRVRLAELEDEPWVVHPAGYGLRTTTEALWQQAGIAPSIAFEGEEVATLRGLVAAGLGVALLPVARSAGAAVPVQIPQLAVADKGCSRTIGLAWPSVRPALAAVDAFRAFVLDDGPALAEVATAAPDD